MQISTNASINNASMDNSSANSIAQLQRRLSALQKQLRDTASGSGDPKAKIQATKLIEAQIQIISAQIAALQREQTQAKDLKVANLSGDKEQNNARGSTTHKSISHVETSIDTYA